MQTNTTSIFLPRYFVFANLFVKVPWPGDCDLFGLPSQAATNTCYYRSNHSKGRGNLVKCLAQGHNKRNCRLIFTL